MHTSHFLPTFQQHHDDHEDIIHGYYCNVFTLSKFYAAPESGVTDNTRV